MSRGDCFIMEHKNEIEKQFQYYDNEYLGGFSSSDYCPVSYNCFIEKLDKYYKYLFNCKFGSYIYKDRGEIPNLLIFFELYLK